ncbi:Hypothetical protein A7982_09035 [Minicystis rosea]|nr:Hypothetical protein A7982_09035 [Minicystis rosea]
MGDFSQPATAGIVMAKAKAVFTRARMDDTSEGRRSGGSTPSLPSSTSNGTDHVQ